MRHLRRRDKRARGRLLAVAGMAAAALLASVVPAAAGDASARALAGAWAPLDRCPVDDPAMLAADGATTAAICLAANATSGSMKIGNTTVPTGKVNLQFGVLRTGSSYTIVTPRSGALVADPVPVPGGLLGLACPSDVLVVSDLCRLLENSPLNAVTASVVPAGQPSAFNFAAGLGSGQPIVRLPVKIHLQNPLLGTECYLGTDASPIVLQPQNSTRPTAALKRFDPNGTLNSAGPMGYFAIAGADQGDATFAIGEATGCGGFGLLNGAVNGKLGLPSAAGANTLTLTNPDTYFGGFYTPSAFAPNEGRQLSDFWHAAKS